MYVDTIGYYSTLKQKGISLFEATWLNMEDIILSEISHSQKVKHWVIPLI
jgi:hypothetical protein